MNQIKTHLQSSCRNLWSSPIILRAGNLANQLWASACPGYSSITSQSFKKAHWCNRHDCRIENPCQVNLITFFRRDEDFESPEGAPASPLLFGGPAASLFPLLPERQLRFLDQHHFFLRQLTSSPYVFLCSPVDQYHLLYCGSPAALCFLCFQIEKHPSCFLSMLQYMQFLSMSIHAALMLPFFRRIQPRGIVIICFVLMSCSVITRRPAIFVFPLISD